MTHAALAAHDEGETVSGLALVVRELFAPLGVEVASTEPEPDNAEYGAVLVRTTPAVGPRDASEPAVGARDASVPSLAVRVRQGKITPTKVGLFVTHWRRGPDRTTGPYDEHDTADVLLVIVSAPSTSEESRVPSQGVFVFDNATLLAQGILARDGDGAGAGAGAGASVGGKRGFRVYPPWSETAPGQATRTQRWQLEHFVPLPLTEPGTAQARRLLTL